MPLIRIHHEAVPAEAKLPRPVKRTKKDPLPVLPAPDVPQPKPEPVTLAGKPEQPPAIFENTESDPVPEPANPQGTPEANVSDNGNDLPTRLTNAIDRVNTPVKQADPSQELLEQAVTLLESLAARADTTDFDALKQRLDNVEQLLAASGNVR